jgi:thioredoxin:protein disulfide reductase
VDPQPISTGSPAKPGRTDRLRWVRGLCFAALAAGFAAPAPAAAQGQPRLLPPERAFAFSVQALDERTLEARFAIADGYYLYRDRLKFSVEPAGLAAAAALPPGKIKDDEFFGRVETYRDRLAVRLSLDKGEPGRKVTVRAESQGCADVGVCYPPQVQNITLALPAPGAGPGAPVEASPARKSWFK